MRFRRQIEPTGGTWAVLWLAAVVVAQVLYAPAWPAGWVRDVSGWLQSLHTQSFRDYLFREGTRVHSLYPFTQLMLWVGFKMWGAAPLPWHLAMVTAHATISWGWARFYVAALQPRWGRQALWAGGGAGIYILFSPYATEVVVWQAGFHYLQGALLMLVSMGSALQLLQTGKKRWAVGALAAFVPTLFALEVFLLTPVYVALLALFAGQAGREKALFVRRLWRWVFMPMIVLCALQYGLFRHFYNQAVPHIGGLHFAQVANWLRKPAKYAFHLFAGGRYWPAGLRQGVYAALNSHLFLGLFWMGMSLISVRLFRRWEVVLKSVWALPAGFGVAAMVLVMPLYFQEAGLVYFDRYAYFMLPAVGALLGIGVVRFQARWLLAGGVLVLSTIALCYTVQLWQKSDALSRKTLQTIPPAEPGTVTVLLNVPNALHGVPMIGAAHEGEAALMRRYVLQRSFGGLLLEPSACNLLTVNDAVEVRPSGPGSYRVTALNGQGWWSGGVLSTDWENEWFRVHFRPAQSLYELYLKKPAGRYRLLVWQAGKWYRL